LQRDTSSFALVHGAWHGAWCWQRVLPAIESRGHRAIAIELSSDRAGSRPTDYAAEIERALDGWPADVILVGHSFGGLAIPLVAQRRPLGMLVYLAALIPEPGRSLSDQFEAGERILIAEGGRELDPAGEVSRWVDRDAAVEALYHDCSDRDAAWAFSRLRPQSRAAQGEPCPLERLPGVETAYVVCRDDRMMSNEWARRQAEARLGVRPIELPGGHSPFLSRPRALADLLISLG
jgi:pimeloyl-ACP methyl ester carboxylesterase